MRNALPIAIALDDPEDDGICECSHKVDRHFHVRGEPWMPALCAECECRDYIHWSEVLDESPS